jgi:rare lipoprotein A
MKNNLFISLFFCILISACSNKSSRLKPEIETDSAPDDIDFDISQIEHWQIQPEELSRYGNHSPYEVYGKQYHVVKQDSIFEQQGKASWYGKKFHGRKTSNMEDFDMYKLTAAHRTLPLPSYVEVTNLDNNKRVIVRVNDRGPFVGKRIIDLSWAAAKLLGYEQQGVANVHIKLIQTPNNKTQIAKTIQQKFLQIGAFSERQTAHSIAEQLNQVNILPVQVSISESLPTFYRVRLGPVSMDENLDEIIQKVHDAGYPESKIVTLEKELENEQNLGLKYLQIGAFSEKNTAQSIANKLNQLMLLPVHITNSLTPNPLFRVRLGPLTEEDNINEIIQKVHSFGYPESKIVTE